MPRFHKLYKWLTDEEYFNNYGLAGYNDQNFLEMIKSSFECKDNDAMFDLAKAVYTYVTSNMGEFDIKNYVLHSQCE